MLLLKKNVRSIPSRIIHGQGLLISMKEEEEFQFAKWHRGTSTPLEVEIWEECMTQLRCMTQY